jgi:hypothetical protein
MSLLKKLFGGGNATPSEQASETHQGFTITPTPVKDGGKYRIGARIEKEVGGTLKTHDLIRADTFDDLDGANTASIGKARQMIDEQGDRLFG